MATKSKKPAVKKAAVKKAAAPANGPVFNCCDRGDCFIHQDLFKQVSDGLALQQHPTAASKARFFLFSLTAAPGTIIKPSLQKKGSGSKTKFVFTLDVGKPTGGDC